MAYIPFTNDYSSQRTPAYVAAELAKRTAVQSRMNDIIVGGNAVMGGLVADCCSDPAYGGQGFYDDSSGAFGTPGSTATNPMAVLPIPGSSVPGLPSPPGSYPLTPVDILTGSYGWPIRRDGQPWPRPRLPGGYRRKQINAFPNFGPGFEVTSLVPPCPCFSTAPPVAIPVPVIATPPPSAPAPVAVPLPPPTVPCPYPACSTGNVCLDLVTGCVLNSQVDQAQTLACTLANYGVFGNMGTFLGDVIHGCQPPKFLGTPLPNPPAADPSMRAAINAAISKQGMGGFGQVDSNPLSGIGGLLAVVAGAGILIWATRK